MHYFALLISPERQLTPEEGAAEMTAYQNFHAKAAAAIRAGDALQPAATGVRITGGRGAPTVTDGPFAESAEVAGGYYVFEAENLDEALALARDIPAAKRGAVEIWPIVEYFPPSKPVGNAWLALLLEPADKAVAPGTPEWEAGIAAHQKFGAAAGDRGNGGPGARRRGATHRRALHRGRRGGERLLHHRCRRPRRGRQSRVDDSVDDGGAPATHGHLWAVAASMTNLDGVFRREWGPAVAALARWSGDFTVAEDAVQEAFTEALRAWPRDGVPHNTGGWIVAVARNRALDRLRRESVRPGKELAAVVDDIRARTDRVDVHPVRDDELRMMFTCAHPALDPTSQLALTLRLISGLTVAEIARALLQSQAAVGQRITRAKNKIRQANIPLRVPPAELLPERTPHVLACIYSVFTEGYWSTAGPSAIRDELCDEGVRLAGELCSLMPDERDAHALAALVLLHDSRRETRVDADGALVSLDEQDRNRWDRSRIARGLDRLALAA